MLSQHRVARNYHAQYDNRATGNFIVWKDDYSCYEFTPDPKGLYYCNDSKTKAVLLTTDVNKINTVEKNMENFNRR